MTASLPGRIHCHIKCQVPLQPSIGTQFEFRPHPSARTISLATHSFCWATSSDTAGTGEWRGRRQLQRGQFLLVAAANRSIDARPDEVHRGPLVRGPRLVRGLRSISFCFGMVSRSVFSSHRIHPNPVSHRGGFHSTSRCVGGCM